MATIKHKTAFREVLKGTTLTKAMKIANYAPSTVKTTGKLTRTKGWKELIEKELPDGLLAERHRELLNKREVNLIRKKGDTGEEIFEVLNQPETQATSKALDMAYKIKGSYAPEKHDIRKINLNITDETAKRIIDRASVKGS